MNGAIGLAVIGLPLAVLGRGTWKARGVWLAMGLLLSWCANVVRLLIIAVTATLFGPDVALNTLHPFLGLILFAMSFALLLCMAPLCGLDVAAP